MRLSKINNFGDELLTDHYINRLKIQMHNFILDKMPNPIDDVEKKIDLSLKRNGGTSYLSKNIQWLPIYHLH